MQPIDYKAEKITTSIIIDGDVSKSIWQNAIWSKRFVDMVSGDTSLYNTQVSLLWNTEHLYIAFIVEEPFITATQTKRDSIIFLENDLEMFIEGDDCYYELEVNAANTLYEVLFVWKDIYKGSRFDIANFNVHHSQVYTFGGDYDRTGESFWLGTHPRGVRWAFTNFDMPGLQTAVRVNGTLNDNSDIDTGWSLEIAIPWSSLQLLAHQRAVPPVAGDVWKMFLGRFQKLLLNGKEVVPHPAMALNSHGIYDTHLPERWSRVQFIG